MLHSLCASFDSWGSTENLLQKRIQIHTKKTVLWDRFISKGTAQHFFYAFVTVAIHRDAIPEQYTSRLRDTTVTQPKDCQPIIHAAVGYRKNWGGGIYSLWIDLNLFGVI